MQIEKQRDKVVRAQQDKIRDKMLHDVKRAMYDSAKSDYVAKSARNNLAIQGLRCETFDSDAYLISLDNGASALITTCS